VQEALSQSFHSQSPELCDEVTHSLLTHCDTCLNLHGDCKKSSKLFSCLQRKAILDKKVLNKQILIMYFYCPINPHISHSNSYSIYWSNNEDSLCLVKAATFPTLTLRRRIKSHLLFAGIIRSSPFSLR